MILLIDNYDSFTYNLFQQISMLGKNVEVVRNDAITIEEIQAMSPEAIILSPGPGTPTEAGITVEVIRELYQEFPILGICLGHQSIGQAFGANIVQAQQIMHGKLSSLQYKKTGLFAQLAGEIQVMRYHSLIIEQPTLHKDFNIIATSCDDGEIMAIQHKEYPLFGLQFHPESIGTKEGSLMMQAFLESIA
ncbi:aminodeoxychorismate/anthranilate synthase component II [Lysinibacillus macroides]|uniref:Anthranilate synthase subunit II n=1 Tax=Lysinibacillus macroides TaxID=33935 RepID=A0A0M9DIH2_9BACI|nr:aminodeoxychorismate/anthranilate synthase component II [Lysinibacillus macroides]KOY80862.1 anthranilate synthase subunit II [Lysinibacillus macroides]QPR68991.1 aminodeoxychorismate/anthranilate synthase component II [Lysinibacillus macroides]